jgi:hypothetical protein
VTRSVLRRRRWPRSRMVAAWLAPEGRITAGEDNG